MGKWAALFNIMLLVIKWWLTEDKVKKARQASALEKIIKASKTGDPQDVLDAFDDINN